jgi:hypothetical protein
MATLNESKVQGTFKFAVYQHPELMSKVFQGTLHLFEHRYNDQFTFWHGVAEIACNQSDVLNIAAKAGAGFVIVLTLADGRTGTAKYLDMLADHTAPGSNITIALVGDKELKGAP